MTNSPTATSDNTDLPRVGTALVDVEDVRAGVEARLQEVLAEQAKSFELISPAASPLIDAWSTLLSGGKRLRAAFAYWGYRAHQPAHVLEASSADQTALYRIGAALELFQAAALFHDDVMDRSDTRRGNPTAHKEFERQHGSHKFVGDAEQYGTSTAILLGDLSLVASESEFRKASAHFADPTQAHNTFDLMRSTVTVGQFLDIQAQVLPWTADLTLAKERAYTIIRTKTSTYSVAHPLVIGAALAGAGAQQLEQLQKFGTPIGVAYQLLDDLLGAFGDPETTGKPAGDDLREGKRTVLVIEAMERLGKKDRELLASSLGRQDLTDAEIDHLLTLIAQSGAVEAINAQVEALAKEGLSHLDDSELNPTGLAMLHSLVAYALKRSN